MKQFSFTNFTDDIIGTQILCLYSWYNRTGWLGRVKHQFTYICARVPTELQLTQVSVTSPCPALSDGYSGNSQNPTDRSL